MQDGIPVLAAVVNPVRGEFYEARAGMGAFLNGRRIFVSGQQELAGARITVPVKAFAKGNWPPPWPGAVPVRANASIYRLALIASGRADAYFALNPKWEWDIAPGALLVSEAGGAVTGKTGAPLTFNSAEAKVGSLAAAAPGLHRNLIERLR